MSVVHPSLIVCIAGLTGIVTCLALYRSVVGGINIYQHAFLARVGSGLKDTFIFLDPQTLLFFNLGLIVFAGAVGFAFFGVPGMVLPAILTAVFPRYVIGQLRKRHAKRFVYQLPDCLNGIASSLRAGASLTRAMEQAAEQQPPPLSNEFAVVLSEYRMGRKLEESFEALHDRIKRPEVELLNSAIAISRAVGGNLADTIDSLAATLREGARVQGKITALTAMGRMQGWIACMIPGLVALVLFKQEPEAMTVLVSEPIGWMTLAVIAIMMLLAIIFIRRIVDIDV